MYLPRFTSSSPPPPFSSSPPPPPAAYAPNPYAAFYSVGHNTVSAPGPPEAYFMGGRGGEQVDFAHPSLLGGGEFGRMGEFETDEGFGGGAVGKYFDMPNFISLPGMIISCNMFMLCSSLYICLGRSDFNLIFYLLGYYIWCIESDVKDYDGLNSLRKAVKRYNFMLVLACILDVMWLFLGFSTWLCETEVRSEGGNIGCFTGLEDSKLKWTYGMHSFVLFLSVINFFVKAAVVIMSFIWARQQGKAVPSSPGNVASPSLRS